MTEKIAIPYGDYLFLEEVQEQVKTALYVPDSVERPSFWRVTYAGPEATVAPGSFVIPSVKHSVKGRVGDTVYVVTKQADLLAEIVEVEHGASN